MKPKHTTLSITLIPLLLALFSACNADASAGLFRQISESRAPIGIVYKQLLAYDTGATTLYYRTDEGIYKTDLTTRTKMQASVKGAIIQASYYAGSDMVQYITNDSSTVKNTTDANIVTPTDTSVIATNDALKIKNLYANGLVMLQGEDISDASKIRYSLVSLTNSATSAPKTAFPYLDGYSLASVLQMSGHDADDVSTTTPPILISFVNLSSDFKYYYYDASSPATDGSALLELTGLTDKRIAAFWKTGTKLFALSSDGDLYAGTAGSAAMTRIFDGSKEYDTHAFFYGVVDGTTTHLISKTNTKAEDLFVYSVDASTNNVTTASIDEGYAEYLANADIVSALSIGPAGGADYVLVATNDNGLFKIEINHAFANINSIANGSSTKSEEYNFDLF